VLGVGRAVLRYADRLTSHRVTLSLLAGLRAWVFDRLEPLAPGVLLRHRSGDLLSRLVADVDELQQIYLRVLSPAIVAMLMGVLTVLILGLFHAALALPALVFLLLAGLGVPLLGRRLARDLGERRVRCRVEQVNLIVDAVQGMADLLSFGQGERQIQQIAEIDRESGRIERRLAWIAGLQAGLTDLATNLGTWVVLAIAIPFALHRQLDGVYLAALALLMAGSFEVVQPLGQALARIGGAREAVSRLFAVADERPAVIDPAEPCPAPRSAALSFDAVSFAYGPNEPRALHEITFTLEQGAWVAVVGPSGAGKSTLISLAMRYWDPCAGALRLGSRDLRDYALDDLRSSFALVGQDTTLFADTLRNNLLLARPGLSDRDLLWAVDRAHLDGLIARLPQGLDTWIGEQGLRLSGGERQRVAIARALLKDAPILLLDEPTANLDPITEGEVLESLFDLMAGRAVLLISHRLVAMERMNEILVLDHGRIAQRGTHATLSGADGLYRELLAAERAVLGQDSLTGGNTWTTPP
jgi:ATP-binding cassette subfamily C protein CydC